ncbi:FAD-dependent oxidoreductase [Nocardia sp. NPDC051570]|uniref:FAD-dependent oxidoreductase n=1 Tax=Nocardia sp. NPDC051570 TaxID=3364324 RepID=UPI0037B2D2C6
MAYVITQRCCNDAGCVAECPVDCIRPTPGQPEFATTEMLYIDPATCIDCGSCVPACPVGAIFAEEDLTAPLRRYGEINAEYFHTNPLRADTTAEPAAPARLPRGHDPLRVAVIGSGPSACYAAATLLSNPGVEIDMFERLPTPWGLIRSGVAPDHLGTKDIAEVFESGFVTDAFAYHLNVTVGQHIRLAELLRHHHAVIYAVGAAGDRRLGIAGEDLPGSHPATEFVAWYNGHPEHADRVFDLSGERAVVIGNGNVALDVARVLTLDPAELARTDIADHALTALRDSAVREVVVLGRRAPRQAAYTAGEFLALGQLPGVDVLIEDSGPDDPGADLKYRLLQEYSRNRPTPGHKRIVLRYLASPIALHGADRVRRLEYGRNEIRCVDGESVPVPTGRTATLDTTLVLRAIGYRGVAMADLPFDEARGVIPNDRGRVLGHDGVYVTGWIKRGPRGVIGTNRTDAEETVAHLLDDFTAGRLRTPEYGRAELHDLLTERRPDRIDRAGWRAIDTAERRAGQAVGRPRIKLTDTAALLAVAQEASGVALGLFPDSDNSASSCSTTPASVPSSAS